MQKCNKSDNDQQIKIKSYTFAVSVYELNKVLGIHFHRVSKKKYAVQIEIQTLHMI